LVGNQKHLLAFYSKVLEVARAGTYLKPTFTFEMTNILSINAT